MPARSYNWEWKSKPLYHEVLLPNHVDEKFKNPEILWNEVEKTEKRIDSQVQMDLVVALPDDSVLSLEDKIELLKLFVQREFVNKGLGAQIDIHPPEKLYSEKNGEIEESDHNLHAHVLLTTRRFDDTGKKFEKKKARDLMASVSTLKNFKGALKISGTPWGKVWEDLQNEFFAAKGIDLKVDSSGIIPQIHLGPVRMRANPFDLVNKNDQLINESLERSKDPAFVLEKITERNSVFTDLDLHKFLTKFLEFSEIRKMHNDFWKLDNIVPLFNENNEFLKIYTSKEVIEEERKIIRLTDRIASKNALTSSMRIQTPDNLNNEQQLAFKNLLSGKRLACLEGHAGTGKSYLLTAIKNECEKNNIKVRALGPDNATAKVLKDHGFSETDNLYHFLFTAYHRKHFKIHSGREVWIIDEAGKIGNKALIELLKVADRKNIQLIFSGNTAQLSPVDRGGMFANFCKRYGYDILQNVQRQNKIEHREVARKLALGQISLAINAISSFGGFLWSQSKNDAMEHLIKTWAKDKEINPDHSSIIIAHTCLEISFLNKFFHEYFQLKGTVNKKEYECSIDTGSTLEKVRISEGDLIQFRKKNRDLNIKNGDVGVLKKASVNEFIVVIKDEEGSREISFNPETFNNFHLGYATTSFRSQGKTLDKAYVLHHPSTNKKMFYVNLTRHVHDVRYFVSRDEARNLIYLKQQALQSGYKDNTLNYLTEEEIQIRARQEERKQMIHSLKDSDSLAENVKGYSFQTFDTLKGGLYNWVKKYTDRIRNRKFYNPLIDSTIYKGKVLPVDENYPSIKDNSPKQANIPPFMRDVYSQSRGFSRNNISANNGPLIKEVNGFPTGQDKAIADKKPLDIRTSPEQEKYDSVVRKFSLSDKKINDSLKDVRKTEKKYSINNPLPRLEIEPAIKEMVALSGENSNQSFNETHKLDDERSEINASPSEPVKHDFAGEFSESDEKTKDLLKDVSTSEKEFSANNPSEKLDNESFKKENIALSDENSNQSSNEIHKVDDECSEINTSSSEPLKQDLEREFSESNEKTSDSLKDASTKKNYLASPKFEKNESVNKEIVGSSDEKSNPVSIADKAEIKEFSIGITPSDLKDITDSIKESISEKVNEREKGKNKNGFRDLEEKNKKLLTSYFEKSQQASSIYEIIKLEKESLGVIEKRSSQYLAWIETCKQRNALAAKVIDDIPSRYLKNIFHAKSYSILEDRANYHINANKPKIDIQEELKNNIDSLVYKLFPDGPTRKDAQGVRFGNKGSLSVALRGANKGCYYDYSEAKGGGPLQLIEKTLGIDKNAAKEWALDFLQHPCETVTWKFKESYKKNDAPEYEWISLQPKSGIKIYLQDISKGLSKSYDLIDTYEYRDLKGDILFYTLRLQKRGTKEKTFFPYSYGYLNDINKTPKWDFKKFKSDSKMNPIFNLQNLTRDISKPVLIVEGEKSANAAQKILKDEFICLSWLGGAGAASKVDWSPLYNRDVVIWPDNDQAGFKAANDICAALRKTGVNSLKVISSEELKKNLPEKWDLADPLPSGLSPNFIKDQLLNAQPKAVSLERLKMYLDKANQDSNEIMKLNEILWRVDQRVRSSLEEKNGSKFWETEKEILKNMEQSLNGKKDIESLAQSHGLPLNENVIFQGILHLAKRGSMPSLDDLHQIKKAFGEIAQQMPVSARSDSIVFYRTLANAVDGKIISNQDIQLLSKTHAESCKNELNQTKKQISLEI